MVFFCNDNRELKEWDDSDLQVNEKEEKSMKECVLLWRTNQEILLFIFPQAMRSVCTREPENLKLRAQFLWNKHSDILQMSWYLWKESFLSLWGHCLGALCIHYRKQEYTIHLNIPFFLASCYFEWLATEALPDSEIHWILWIVD